MKLIFYFGKNIFAILFLGIAIFMTSCVSAAKEPLQTSPSLILNSRPISILELTANKDNRFFSKIKPSEKTLQQAKSDCGVHYSHCIQKHGQVAAGAGISQCGVCLNICSSTNEWPFYNAGCSI